MIRFSRLRFKRFGKSPPAYFSIGSQWQFFQRHKDGGNHVIGKFAFQVLADGQFYWFPGIDGNHIGHQSFFFRGLSCRNNRRVFYAGLKPDDGGNFTGLDSKPANFHLVIVSAKKVYRSVGLPTAKISRVIQAAYWIFRERVGNKSPGGAKAKSGELGLSLTRFFEEAVEDRLARLEQRPSTPIELPVSSARGPTLTNAELQRRLLAAELKRWKRAFCVL